MVTLVFTPHSASPLNGFRGGQVHFHHSEHQRSQKNKRKDTKSTKDHEEHEEIKFYQVNLRESTNLDKGVRSRESEVRTRISK